MTLSVIVPVYNAEKYLSRCLDSLLQQWPHDRNDYEVICVNDGSTDRSGEILRAYHAKYPQIIKIVDQENQGLPGARNAGQLVATGEIITFCDSDDYVTPNGYYFLYNNLWDVSLDILRFYSVTLDKYVLETWKEPEHLSDKIVFEGRGIDCLQKYDTLSFVWSNFYRRSFLQTHNIKTSPIVMCEDMSFNLDAYVAAARVQIVNTNIYRYTVSDTQITKKRDPRTMSRAVEGYLFFFNQIYNVVNAVPGLRESLSKTRTQQLSPFLSRALSANFDRKDFLQLQKKMHQLDILPVEPAAGRNRIINLMMMHYSLYSIAGFLFTKLFLPYILPRLHRN